MLASYYERDPAAVPVRKKIILSGVSFWERRKRNVEVEISKLQLKSVKYASSMLRSHPLGLVIPKGVRWASVFFRSPAALRDLAFGSHLERKATHSVRPGPALMTVRCLKNVGMT